MNQDGTCLLLHLIKLSCTNGRPCSTVGHIEYIILFLFYFNDAPRFNGLVIPKLSNSKTGWEINLDKQISDINEKSGQQKNKSVIKTKSIKSIKKTPTMRLEPTMTQLKALCSTNWARGLCGYTIELGAIIYGAELGDTSTPRRLFVPAQHVPRRHSL
jgi:hypothetical protein